MPQPGSQRLVLACPVYELLNDGTRGSAKTDTLLFDYYRGVGQGYGTAWSGIIFRRTYPELAEVIKRSLKWFTQLPDRPAWNGSDHLWRWPDGETLRFRYARTPEDYWAYHGHEYPWMGFEELTSWPTPQPYTSLKSCCRTGTVGVPRRIRCNTNPYGAGHNWVKRRFVDPAPARTIIEDSEGTQRIRITSYVWENRALLEADPDYPKRIASGQAPHIVEAWLRCNWNIVAGGMFDDLWDERHHVLPPVREIPRGWYIDRSYDWGSAKPWAVLWHAESDGESPLVFEGGEERTFPRGSVVTFSELYGATRENEGDRATNLDQARRVLEREASWSWKAQPGPADTAIFDIVNGRSIADEQSAVGVTWTRAQKGPGSRVIGWQAIRQLLLAAKQQPAEEPGWWVTSTCRNLIRTIATAPRDEKNQDDLDSDSEDHLLDGVRYRLVAPAKPVRLARSMPPGW